MRLLSDTCASKYSYTYIQSEREPIELYLLDCSNQNACVTVIPLLYIYLSLLLFSCDAYNESFTQQQQQQLPSYKVPIYIHTAHMGQKLSTLGDNRERRSVNYKILSCDGRIYTGSSSVASLRACSLSITEPPRRGKGVREEVYTDKDSRRVPLILEAIFVLRLFFPP